MSLLGDSFSEEFRSDFALKTLKPYAVIKCKYENAKPKPKVKRFVVVGESDSHFALVIINSNINKNIYPPNSIQFPLQIKLIKTGSCKYLEWDSYADCSHLIYWEKALLLCVLTKEIDQSLGYLEKNHEGIVVSAIRSNRLLSLAKKKEFGLL
jgi:hypothetical protein